MKLIKRLYSKLKYDNHGYTMAELLAVMGVMVVLAGLLSYSIMMIYGRDGEVTAKKINDVLTDARLYAMSKPEDFSVKLTTNHTGLGNTVEIITGYGTTSESVYESIDLKKKVYITFGDEGSLPATAVDGSVVVTFNKKGLVKSISTDPVGTDVTNRVLQARCVSVRNGRGMNLFLVTSTGRHYVER